MSAKAATASHWAVALLLALAVTLALVAIHLLKFDHRAELLTLDLRFSWLSTAPGNDRIVHIDIDDRSLDELGRWPWPRKQLAGIVDLLNQAGAEAVALDIIMPEPQDVRYVSPATDTYSGDFSELIGTASPRAIFDDAALRQVLVKYPKTFLPMHINPRPPAPTALERRVKQIMLSGRESFQDIKAAALGNLQGDTHTAQLEAVCRAYLRSRGLSAMGRFAVPSDRIIGCPQSTGGITPPLVTLAEACYGSGFVTFDPDLDGVVRRIPMLAGDGSNTYPQFALALAAHQLARRHGGDYALSADANAITIRCADGLVKRIPIDQSGQMLINWHRPVEPGSGGPMHISAAKIGSTWLLAESLETNRIRRRLFHFAIMEMARCWPSERLRDLYFQIADCDRKVNGLYNLRMVAETERQRALVFDPANTPPAPEELQAQERQVEAEIDRLCDEFRKELGRPGYLEAFLAKPLAGTSPATAPATPAADYGQQRPRAEHLLAQIDRVGQANAEIRRDLAGQVDELRGLIGGKLCMVGSVATGAADFVPTPIERRMPGVWVHANILNTIVSGPFVRASPVAVNVVVILLAGMVVALAAATRPVTQAGPLAMLIAGGYAAANAFVVFGKMNVWLPMVAPLAAMAATLLVVTAYRQLTEERAKRHIRGLFAHALSPALVDRLIEDPSLAKLGGERRELTFFFSDLQGFTPLAERLGEQQTVRLLNRYFDRMTDVIQNRRGGYLNKFLGDGLFVFFGAPVFQDDHAARAIRAAIDCQTEIEQLNRELSQEIDKSAQLTVRIGIATGDVMVGNCGSTHRMDYTAIGDPVNLASRLESANKFFGTLALVSDEAWRQGGSEDLLARPLGKVLVVGKKEPAAIWHLLGRADHAGDDVKAAYQRFAEAMALFARRQFTEAVRLFEEILQVIPHDRPAEIFRDLCRQYQTTPPAEDWNAALQLTEK